MLMRPVEHLDAGNALKRLAANYKAPVTAEPKTYEQGRLLYNTLRGPKLYGYYCTCGHEDTSLGGIKNALVRASKIRSAMAAHAKTHTQAPAHARPRSI